MVAVPLVLGSRPAAPERAAGERGGDAAPEPAGAGTPLVDRFGRVHRDLRVSLTDRCSLRCTYCMPEQGSAWLARESILTVDEIVDVVRVAAGAGIRTVRLTGGEPLLRRDLVDVVARIAAIPTPDGPLEVAMTTNGIGLPRVLDDLVAAGLTRVNISLDTLRRERFVALTRRDRLDEVLEGIAAAAASPLRPLKLNTVAMRGVNDDELVELVDAAIGVGATLRFIEQMPLDAGHTWRRESMVTRAEILAALGTRWSLEPVAGRGGAPAERFLLHDGEGRTHEVGVIASVTAPFCGDCDRVRLTADGQIRNCLFATDEHDLRPALRGGATGGARDAAIEATLRASIAGKLPGHAIDDPSFLQPPRGMNAIGG